jgi:dUTP pyrophosphatase
MNFLSNSNSNIYTFNSFMNTLLHTTGHDRFMHLKLFVDSDPNSDELKKLYEASALTHNQKIMADPHFFDAGFDLFLPYNTIFDSENVNKVDFRVKCCAQIHYLSMNNDADSSSRKYFSGFYVHPRSSLSKTPLRLANATGIIDAGYRGNLIGMLDCNYNTNSASSSNYDFTMAQFTRLLQICAPSLMPIYVEVVDSIEDLGPITSRGGGGIGSTGV